MAGVAGDVEVAAAAAVYTVVVVNPSGVVLLVGRPPAS
jgi:hypothetical protein